MESDDIKTSFSPQKHKIEQPECNETLTLWKGQLLAADPSSCLQIFFMDLECGNTDPKF